MLSGATVPMKIHGRAELFLPSVKMAVVESEIERLPQMAK